MKICALDASTLVASVALLEDDTLVYEANLIHGLTHSQKLMPLVEDAFAMAGWSARELDCLGVVAGPGSFTGLRIGVSTVKGMAKALDRPVAGLSTLAVLAGNVPFFPGLVVPMLDARRQQVYTAMFHDGQRMMDDSAMELEEILSLADGPACFLGDGAAAYREQIIQRLGEDAHFAPLPLMHQRAGVAAQLTKIAFEQGQITTADALSPFYVRASSAKKAAWKQ